MCQRSLGYNPYCFADSTYLQPNIVPKLHLEWYKKYGKVYGYVTYRDGFQLQLTLMFISTNRSRDLRQTVNMNFYHGTKVSLKLVLYCSLVLL